MPHPQNKVSYSLSSDPNNYLSLWKYFTDDAQSVKDRMWTLATWLYAGLTGLLGFAVEKCFKDNSIPNNIMITEDKLVIVVSALGVLLSGFSIYLLYMYGMHIRSAWNRADYLRRNIQGLSDVWYLGDLKKIEIDLNSNSHSEKLPPVSLYLILIAAFYGLLFISIPAYILP